MSKSPVGVVLFEDDAARTTEPLSLTRPVWDLRCGIRTLGQKILATFPESSVFYCVRPHLRGILENYLTPEECFGRDLLWINGSLIPDVGFKVVHDLGKGEAWENNSIVVAFRGDPPRRWKPGTHLGDVKFHLEGAPAEIGRLIRYPWELVNAMNAENAREARSLRSMGEIRGNAHPTATFVENGEIFIGDGCQVAPGVVIDASNGPIVVDENALIGANSVIEGPTYIGPGTQVKPLSHIRGSCLGEQCRVGGEVSVSILQGFTNKQHGGFLGHSFLGAWCNLGSGTETSNLKNNYTHVKVQVGTELVDTGELFVGLTMGDHSKSAIGTSFNTGTVVGVACIILGGGFPPRFIPSFHWGGSEKLTAYPLHPTLDSIRAAMARRDRKLSDAEIEVLTWIYKNRVAKE